MEKEKQEDMGFFDFGGYRLVLAYILAGYMSWRGCRIFGGYSGGYI